MSRKILLHVLLFLHMEYCRAVTGVKFSRPCTELTPLSLLDFYIPDHSHLPAGVEIIYDKAGDIHAYRFQPGIQMYRFPAARLFVHCRFFPEEFSLLFTFKTDRKSLHTDQCIVALMPESSRSKVKVGIRLRRGRIGVDFTESSGKRRILTEFRSPHLFDQRWHTVVLSVTADRVGLRVDCGKRKFRRLRRSFPSLIDTTDDNIHLGNCNSVRRGQYTGLLKDVILLSGSDISTLACPSTSPLLPDFVGSKIMLSSAPSTAAMSCTWSDTGKLGFNIFKQDLQVCFSGAWKNIIPRTEAVSYQKMDYIVWHQDIVTASPIVDIETFRIPEEGLFMATACFDSREFRKQQSTIFKWEKNRFVVYQSLYTLGARSWKFFHIGKQYFLAIASHGIRRDRPSKSAIYAWSRRNRRFQLHQELVTWTALGVEYVRIQEWHFLAVANHVNGSDYSLNSTIFRWDPERRHFLEFQEIPTSGALDWTHFSIDGYHFLVVANSVPDSNHTKGSVIYFWQSGKFIKFQVLETEGTTDWEYFRMGDDYYLAAANGFKSHPDGLSQRPSLPVNVSPVNNTQFITNSTVFRFNKFQKVFEKYQDITTYGAMDLESFVVGQDHYIITSNSLIDDDSRAHDWLAPSKEATSSVIYRWQGVEKFVPVHYMEMFSSVDWETFSTGDETYLVYANDKDSISQVYRVKTV